MWVLDESQQTPWIIRAFERNDLPDSQELFIIRRASCADIPAMLECEEAAWESPEQRASDSQLISRMKHNPDGLLIITKGGLVLGIICLIGWDFPWEKESYPDHYELGSRGTLTNHNPLGNTWCGVNIGVRADAPEFTGVALGQGIFATAVLKGIPFVHGPARIPGYHTYAKELTPLQYVQQRDDEGVPLDRMVGFMEFLGFKFERVQENFYEDPESCNYAAIWKWENPYPLFQQLNKETLLFMVPEVKRWDLLKSLGMTWSHVLGIMGRHLFNQPRYTCLRIRQAGDSVEIPEFVLSAIKNRLEII